MVKTLCVPDTSFIPEKGFIIREFDCSINSGLPSRFNRSVRVDG